MKLSTRPLVTVGAALVVALAAASCGHSSQITTVTGHRSSQLAGSPETSPDSTTTTSDPTPSTTTTPAGDGATTSTSTTTTAVPATREQLCDSGATLDAITGDISSLGRASTLDEARTTLQTDGLELQTFADHAPAAIKTEADILASDFKAHTAIFATISSTAQDERAEVDASIASFKTTVSGPEIKRIFDFLKTQC